MAHGMYLAIIALALVEAQDVVVEIAVGIDVVANRLIERLDFAAIPRLLDGNLGNGEDLRHTHVALAALRVAKSCRKLPTHQWPEDALEARDAAASSGWVVGLLRAWKPRARCRRV